MRLTERLLIYLEYKAVTVYSFEKTCSLGNGYLGKQNKGKGSVGSDILAKIALHYPDLNLNWLITGQGKMLQKQVSDIKNTDQETMAREEVVVYKIRNKLVDLLKTQIKELEDTWPTNRSRKKR